MTKQQIKTINELLVSPDFKGKKALRHLLWLNTATPKYNVGDCVYVTERATSVYGYRVINFKGKITKCFTFNTDEVFRYGIDIYCKCGDKETTAYVALDEDEIQKKAPDNINILGEAKSKHEQATDVYI